MRHLRELTAGAWYEIHTSVNNREPLFRSRQTLALFAQVLGETAERFSFELRAPRLEGCRLAFYIKPEDGLQLPRIMQRLKQTFAARYNSRHGRTGHIWGDRYWSRILESGPPDEAESWTGGAMGVEAAELSPARGGFTRGGARRGRSEPRVSRSARRRVSPLSVGVSPLSTKSAQIPRPPSILPG